MLRAFVCKQKFQWKLEVLDVMNRVRVCNSSKHRTLTEEDRSTFLSVCVICSQFIPSHLGGMVVLRPVCLLAWYHGSSASEQRLCKLRNRYSRTSRKVYSCVFRRLPEPNRACLVGVYAFLIWNNLCDLVYQTPTKSYQSQKSRFSTPART